MKHSLSKSPLCFEDIHESSTGWQQIVQQLYLRGVKQVGLVVSDGLKGIEDAIAAVYGSVAHQLCVIHLKRALDRKVHLKDRPALQAEISKLYLHWMIRWIVHKKAINALLSSLIVGRINTKRLLT